MAKGMDPLGDLPSDSDADSDDAAPFGAPEKTSPAKPSEAKIDYEDLRKHGMKTAPTLEGIKGDGGGEGTWGWSRGSRDAGRDAMTGEELHEATNAGLERACAKSVEAAEAKRNARAADRERREAEIATRRRRERETRQALRADDRASRALGAKQRRTADSERPARALVREGTRAPLEGASGAFGFDR